MNPSVNPSQPLVQPAAAAPPPPTDPAPLPAAGPAGPAPAANPSPLASAAPPAPAVLQPQMPVRPDGSPYPIPLSSLPRSQRALVNVPVGNKGMYYLIGSFVLLLAGFFTVVIFNVIGGILGGIAMQGAVQTNNKRLKLWGAIAVALNLLSLIAAYALKIAHD